MLDFHKEFRDALAMNKDELGKPESPRSPESATQGFSKEPRGKVWA